MTNLAVCRCNGWGVDQSIAEARRLIELAMANGETNYPPAILQNLNAYIQQDSPLLGQRVVLRGLNTEALNGTRSTAIDEGHSREGS